jgi:hypothetical protein
MLISATTAGGAAGMMEALVCHPLGMLYPDNPYLLNFIEKRVN